MVSSDMQGTANTFVIEALVIGGDPRVLRVILTPYLLHLARYAIVKLERLPPPPGLDLAKARPLRLTLLAGVAVLAICDGRSVEKQIWNTRNSFAKTSRREAAIGPPPSDEILEQTRIFLQAHGITMMEGM